jgi:peptidoglycan hydrolase-like protein with peptidoglycan-binding domain
LRGLKDKVSTLESQAQSKDEEITSLRDALTKASQQPEAMGRRVVAEVKSRPNVKQTQIALQNAGYNPGTIDGKMGKQTVEAIKAFQKANNLNADGKVGKMTWALLKEYLYKKSK